MRFEQLLIFFEPSNFSRRWQCAWDAKVEHGIPIRLMTKPFLKRFAVRFFYTSTISSFLNCNLCLHHPFSLFQRTDALLICIVSNQWGVTFPVTWVYLSDETWVLPFFKDQCDEIFFRLSLHAFVRWNVISCYDHLICVVLVRVGKTWRCVASASA